MRENRLSSAGIILILTLALSVTKLTAGTAQEIPLTDSGNAINAELSPEWKIKICVLVGSYRPRYPDQPFQSGSWWGSINEPPKTAIKMISLSVREKNIFIEQSAYDYLGSPRNLSLKIDHKILLITIFGGETASGYTAQFQVNHTKLLSRKVFLNEFPDDVCDKTVYIRNIEQ